MIGKNHRYGSKKMAGNLKEVVNGRKFERRCRTEQESAPAPSRTTIPVRSKGTLLCGLRAVSCVNQDACPVRSDSVLGAFKNGLLIKE